MARIGRGERGIAGGPELCAVSVSRDRGCIRKRCDAMGARGEGSWEAFASVGVDALRIAGAIFRGLVFVPCPPCCAGRRRCAVWHNVAFH
eukprot:4733693-Prymnesium_polylepis.1